MGQLSTKLEWELANPKWAATINPVLALPILNGNQINNIQLQANNSITINHLLQRMPQGWWLTDNTNNTTVCRTQPFNDLTITLRSTLDTNISFWIF